MYIYILCRCRCIFTSSICILWFPVDGFITCGIPESASCGVSAESSADAHIHCIYVSGDTSADVHLQIHLIHTQRDVSKETHIHQKRPEWIAKVLHIGKKLCTSICRCPSADPSADGHIHCIYVSGDTYMVSFHVCRSLLQISFCRYASIYRCPSADVCIYCRVLRHRVHTGQQRRIETKSDL